MVLERLAKMLNKTVLLDPNEIDYEELLPVLREFRSTVALEATKFQNAALIHESLLSDLVALVDKMFGIARFEPRSMLAFSIGVQCIVNLMTDNDAVRNKFADKCTAKLIQWLTTEGPKQQNYVCAALLNIDKVGRLESELNNSDFVCPLIKMGESGVEFAVLLLQNLLKNHGFSTLYTVSNEEHKLFLLQLLESMLSESEHKFFEELTFISNLFKRSCDDIMKCMPSVNNFIALQLASLLEFLASASYKQEYMTLLQNDASLIINTAYLLRGIHECVTQKKTWRESLEEAVESIKGGNEDVERRPFFGVKGNLIRLLGNLAYRNKQNQDQIREAGCIPIILDSCKLDGENPFIKEWSILTIRNLCDCNKENQSFIKNMNYEGCDLGIVQDMSLTLADEDGNKINIAPIQRR